MIAYSYEEWPIGKIVKVPHMTDLNKNSHYNVTLYVKGESSREEYIKYCRETDCFNLIDFDLLNNSKIKYYEVLMD